jgi:hypothetical protein
MAGPIRVFLSHSSLDRDITDAVAAGLRPPADGSGWGYEVLLDHTELKAGVQWPVYLHEWMARCHAAVVLLTKNAVESDWVLKEATILTWRVSIDPNFRFFIVRFPDVDDALLAKRGYSPLFLSQIQQVASRVPADIVRVVRERVGQPAAKRTQFERVVGELSDLLTNVGANALEELASALNVVPPTYAPAGERDAYVDALARHLVCGVLGDLTIAQLADTLKSAGAATVSAVLRIVSCYWIDAGAAAVLPPLLAASLSDEAAGAQAAPRAVGINGALLPQYTAEMFVRRAHMPSLLQNVIQVGGGWDGQIVEHVTREICNAMRRHWEDDRLSDDTVIRKMRLGDPTRYALLPGVPDPMSLESLIEAFPRVVFLLCTGESLEELRNDNIYERVKSIEPAVDLDREWQEYSRYTDADKLVKKLK